MIKDTYKSLTKNNNVGFTLIEILAVIVILSVIAIITVPLIGNAIDNSKKKAFELTAYRLIDAADLYYGMNLGSNKTIAFNFNNNKKGVSDEGEKIEFRGESPSVGFLRLYADGSTDLNVCNDKYCACKGKNTSKIFVLAYDEGVCALNPDGSVSDNPITAVVLEDLKNKVTDLNDKLNEANDKINDLTNKVNDLDNNFGKKAYPIGSIYISLTNKNPAELFGGTWEPYAQGRTLVGVGTGTDTNNTQRTFTLNQIGGAYTHVLTIGELAAHSHTGSTDVQGSHSHNITTGYNYVSGAVYVAKDQKGSNSSASTDSAGEHNHNLSINSTGNNQAHNNIQPYTAVYMWKRVA